MPKQEQWRPVPGFPNYEVSDRGQVVSHCRRTPRTLKSQAHKDGYGQVGLYAFGKYACRTVHSLVAEAFLGPRPDGMEVRHLNGDPSDNRVENLAYGTHRQNMADRSAHGRHAQANKVRCKHGHPFTPENTGRAAGRGHRFCKICARGAVARYRTRQAFRAAGIEVAA